MAHRGIAIALGTLAGLQALRALLPLLVYGLRDRLGVPTTGLGLGALVLFSAAFLAPRLVRRAPLDRALGASLLGLVLARLALPFAGFEPLVSLGVAVVATLAFLGLLAVATRAASASPEAARGVAWAALAGAIADVSIHALAGTRDLHWGGVGPDLGSLALALAGGSAAVLLLRRPGGAPAPPPTPPPARPGGLAGVGWGAWLFLHLEILGNVARESARTGSSPEIAGVVAAAGLAVGAAVSGSPARGRATTLGAGAVLLGALALLGLPDARPATAALPLARVAAAVLLLRSLATPRPPSGASFGGGFLLFLALFFGHYAGYDLALPIGRGPLLAIAAVALTAAGLRAPSGPAVPARPPSRLVAGLAALVALPLLAAPIASRPSSSSLPLPGDRPLVLVTFNLHNGFDERGGFALDRMLDELAAIDADVVALQEVSRGWVINGGADLFELARARLGMGGAWGPSAGGDWGNAVFARAPILTANVRALPPADLPLPRSILEVSIPIARDGGSRRGRDRDARVLRVFATHLHHVEGDPQVREEQTRFLAATLPTGGEAILLGDFNALPTDRCVVSLAEAGWRDVHDPAAGPAPTYPSRAPVRRIDTILVTESIERVASRVAPAWGSDHRAVVAEIVPAGAALSR